MWLEASEQAPKAALPVSIEHSSEAPPSAEKPKVGVESSVGPVGPESTEIPGAVESSV